MTFQNIPRDQPLLSSSATFAGADSQSICGQIWPEADKSSRAALVVVLAVRKDSCVKHLASLTAD